MFPIPKWGLAHILSISTLLRTDTFVGHEGESGGGDDGENKERHCLEAHQDNTGAHLYMDKILSHK